MTVPDRLRLTLQLAILKEVTIDYQGKTIDNIIQQMEARLNEVVKQEPI
mgnify:CR=1 FL=1